MRDPLNYQPSRSAVYYTPPQRIDPGRTVLGVVIAAVGIAVISCAYSLVLPKVFSISLRLAAPFVAAAAIGLMGMFAVRFGRVRIALVAGFIGAFLSLFALWVMWVAWVDYEVIRSYARISLTTLMTNPAALWRVIGVL